MAPMETLPHENDNEATVQPEEPLAVVQERQGMHCYISSNGNVVFDKHPSDQSHLTSPATRSEQPLYDCRVYLRDLVPKEWIDKRGTLRISRMTTSKKVVVSITFFPEESAPSPAP